MTIYVEGQVILNVAYISTFFDATFFSHNDGLIKGNITTFEIGTPTDEDQYINKMDLNITEFTDEL